MMAVSTERTMTVREVAEILNLDPRTIQMKVKELFPDLVQERKTTYLNERQVTMVKMSCEKKFAVQTDLEKELIIQQALMFQKEKILDLEQENRTLRIKAEVADQIANSEGLFCLTDMGKIIGTHPRKIIWWLEEIGVLYRRKRTRVLLPRTVFQDRGYFKVNIDPEKSKEQTMVTPRGLEWVCAKYNKAHNLLNFPGTYRSIRMEAVMERSEIKVLKDIRDTAEIAEYLSISKSQILRYIHRVENPIPHIKVSDRVYRFDRAKVDEWLEKLEVK